MADTAVPPRVHFPTLDGYRAIAALAVVVFHVLADAEFHASNGYLGETTFRLGNYGVTVFFVLSGFLLYRPHVRGDIEGHPRPRLGQYFVARFLRIIPAYWAAVTAVILLKIEEPDSWLDVVSWYGFAQIYRAATPLDGLGVAWTLNIEMAFYLALPFIAWAITKLPGSPVRRQALGIALLVVIGWGYRLWYVAADVPQHYSFFLPGYIDWFAVGMALALWSTLEHAERPVPGFVALLAARPWISLVLAAEMYWLLVQMNLPTGFVLETETHTLLRFPIAGLSAGFLLLPGVLGQRPEGVGHRLLTWGPLRTAGLISYGIYLWHLIVIRQIDDWQLEGWFPTSVWVSLPVVTIATLALASLSYALIEMPVIDLRRRRKRVDSTKLSPSQPSVPVLSGSEAP